MLACAQEDEDLAHIVAERLAAQHDTLLDLGLRHSSLGKKKKKRRDEHDCLLLEGLARSVVRFGTSPGEYSSSAAGNNTCYNAVSRGLFWQCMRHCILITLRLLWQGLLVQQRLLGKVVMLHVPRHAFQQMWLVRPLLQRQGCGPARSFSCCKFCTHVSPAVTAMFAAMSPSRSVSIAG